METKHTPGPWTHVSEPRPNGGPHWETIEADGNILAEAYGYEGSPDEQHANARLIAEAPELLAALKAAEEYMGAGVTPCSQPYPLERVRAAIAKAEGSEG